MSTAAPEPKENMGKPEPRIDGRLKVTGEARYGSDFPVANPAYGFLVTSAIAKGSVTAMELNEAKAIPGVLEIFYHENSRELKEIKYRPGGGGPTSSIQDFGPEISYGGQIIALVVAETFEAAREAAHKVHVTYQAEQPSATFSSSGVNEEDISKQREVPQAGDAEAAYSAAEVKLDAEYETPTQHHNSIELFTTTCVWQGDQLTIYEPSQFSYGLKANAAKKMDIDIANVHVVSPFVGGAFGSKAQFSPRTGLVALAARRLNRPVKLVATRDQGFTIQTYCAETRLRIRMGAQRDGKITSFIHEGWEVTSRPDSYSVAGVEDSARLYGFGAVKTRVSLVHADRNTPGFMRSPPVESQHDGDQRRAGPNDHEGKAPKEHDGDEGSGRKAERVIEQSIALHGIADLKLHDRYPG
jgi:xanthine dehydrogenase YagR molybdenum-binding subunit